jgi:hypothetical protein
MKREPTKWVPRDCKCCLGGPWKDAKVGHRRVRRRVDKVRLRKAVKRTGEGPADEKEDSHF